MLKKVIMSKNNIPEELSKIFNIVLNAERVNAPEKIGYCKEIYDNYFKKEKNKYSYEKAFQYYKKMVSKQIKKFEEIEKESTNVLFIETIEYFKIMSNIIEKGTEENKRVEKYLKGKRVYMKRREYNILNIINYKESEKTFSKIKILVNEMKKYTLNELKVYANMYFLNLVSYDSMIGSWIEEEIKRILKKILKKEMKESTKEEDKKGIDGWIEGKAISIKSIKYKNSLYRRRKDIDITKIINGRIIFYKIDIESPRGFVIEEFSKIINQYKD